jgi:hypothetical protein
MPTPCNEPAFVAEMGVKIVNFGGGTVPENGRTHSAIMV